MPFKGSTVHLPQKGPHPPSAIGSQTQAERVNSGLRLQARRSVGVFSPASMRRNECSFQLACCPSSPDSWHHREQRAARQDILLPPEESAQRSEGLIPACRSGQRAAFRVTFPRGFEPRQSGFRPSCVKLLPFHWLIILSRVRSQLPLAEGKRSFLQAPLLSFKSSQLRTWLQYPHATLVPSAARYFQTSAA